MYCRAFANFFNKNYIIFKEFSKDCYLKVKTGLNDLKALILKIPEFNQARYNNVHM